MIRGSSLPSANKQQQPKTLAVSLDTHFTFSLRTRGVAEWARFRLGIIKALARVSWGLSKEVLLLTYQMLIEPILTMTPWFGSFVITPRQSPACSLYRTHPCAYLTVPSRWLPSTIFSRRRPYSLTRLSLQTPAPVTSGTPCSLASNPQYPLTSSMASCLPTPLASPFDRSTPLKVAHFFLSVPSFSHLPKIASHVPGGALAITTTMHTRCRLIMN